jgi:TonB-linked SusC/RagA family outer membrane protein
MRTLVRLGVLLGIGLLPAVAQAQTGVVRGRVVDARNGAPLTAVVVHIPDLSLGTLSDDEGRYSLTGVAPGPHEIRAELIGHATRRQAIDVAPGATLTIDFSLETSAIGLDEIVVTGTAGAQQRRSLGNTVGRIDAAQLQQTAPSLSVEDLLSGGEAGMNVSFGGQGRIGGGANIRIRGASSIALGSQPLLYVDGVRVNNEYAAMGPGTTQNSPPSRWDDLNPDEIQSVEVIKGPAAATLYGTEASNGVINIITKRGQAGTPRFTISAGQGANWWLDPENAFGKSYYRCRGISKECTVGEIVEFNVLKEDRVRNGNEYFHVGRPYSLGGSVEGGLDRLRYYASVDWDHDEGVLTWDWKNRLNGRINLTVTPSDKLDIQLGLGGVKSKYRDAGDRTYLGIARGCGAPGCEAGSGNNAVDGLGRGYFIFSPDAMRDAGFGYEEVLRSIYNFQINHRPTNWFNHRITTGVDWAQVDNSVLRVPIAFGHDNLLGRKQAQLTNSSFVSLDYSATGTLNLGPELSFATSGGVQYYQKSFHTIFADGNRFAVKGLETITAGAVKTATEDFLENKTIGAYVQEQLSWRNRLFVTVAARGDDNSAFGTNYDFVLYPKASFSWVVSDEPFLSGVSSWLTQLRLRGAWGKAGQQPDALAARRTYVPFSAPGGQVAVTPQNAGNPDLRPEVGEEIEVGFDASFFGDRLAAEVTYYNKLRRDAIITVPTRPSLGFPGVTYQNLGEIANSGLEAQLQAQLYTGSTVGVDMNVSLSTNSNEITDMSGVPPQILEGRYIATSWTRQLFAEGFPLGAIFLKRIVSADIQGSGPTAKAVNVMCEGGQVLPISLPSFPIARGNGSVVPCAQAPHLFAGASLPTRLVTGGTTVTLFQNVKLYAQVDYAGGHKMIDGDNAGRALVYKNSRAILERTDPILLGYESLGGDGLNQAGLYDASFARLRRVSVSFELPPSLTQRLMSNRVSMTISANDLWLLWRAQSEVFGQPILEPEARFTTHEKTDPGGLHAGTQDVAPAMKRLMATLRVTF